MAGLHHQHRLVGRHEALILHFDGHAQGGRARALAVAGLQHEQAPVLHSELGVLG